MKRGLIGWIVILIVVLVVLVVFAAVIPKWIGAGEEKISGLEEQTKLKLGFEPQEFYNVSILEAKKGSLVIVATDPNGRYVTNFPPSGFVVRDNGQVRDAYPDTPKEAYIALIVDTSKNAVLTSNKKLAKGLSGLNTTLQVYFQLFAAHNTTKGPAENLTEFELLEENNLNNALDSLNSTRDPLQPYAPILLAANSMPTFADAIKAVLIISEGDATRNSTQAKSVNDTLNSAGINLFVVSTDCTTSNIYASDFDCSDNYNKLFVSVNKIKVGYKPLPEIGEHNITIEVRMPPSLKELGKPTLSGKAQVTLVY